MTNTTTPVTDVELKTLVNPNFTTLMYEVEEHLNTGWRIHTQHYPTHHFTFFEVVLYKDAKTITRARDILNEVIEGRKEAIKEERLELIPKMQRARAKKSAERREGQAVQSMLASVEMAKGENDEG